MIEKMLQMMGEYSKTGHSFMTTPLGHKQHGKSVWKECQSKIIGRRAANTYLQDMIKPWENDLTAATAVCTKLAQEQNCQ